jgi:hypothetical protein
MPLPPVTPPALSVTDSPIADSLAAAWLHSLTRRRRLIRDPLHAR